MNAMSSFPSFGPFKMATAFVLLTVALLAAGMAGAQTAADPCSEGPQLYREGKFEEARTALEACLEQQGDSVEILLPLVVMAVQADRSLEGIDYGERAVALAPDDPEARYWYGRALLRGGRVGDARAEWEQGLQLSVIHKGILEGLARMAMTDGEHAKAYQLLSQLQLQGVNEPWLNRLMADIAAGKGLWQQSLDHLESAMSKESPSLQDYMTASELSILLGDHQGALSFCRQAVELEPGPVSYGGLGEAYFAVEEVDSALVYLRLAVEQAPDDPRNRFNLANALEVAGMIEESDSHFRAFLAMVPDDPVGRFNYGIHLDKLGRSEEALAEVSRAIELNPNMLTARVVKAQILEDMGRWDEALEMVVALNEIDDANTVELNKWEEKIRSERDFSRAASYEGKIHLLHIIVGDPEVLALLITDMEAGMAFTTLAVQYSSGRAAAKGGDIGWINPAEMVEPMKSAIIALELNETSPPVEAGGLFHVFKRIP
jgi:tetratricopeptide (TPR) repeat protein